MDECPTTRKITFPTPQLAWRAALAIVRRNRLAFDRRKRTAQKHHIHRHASAYRCQYCRRWHVTSNE